MMDLNVPSVAVAMMDGWELICVIDCGLKIVTMSIRKLVRIGI